MADRLVIKTWEELKAFHGRISADDKRRWLYRGQSDYLWDLKSGLERVMKRFGLDASDQEQWERHLVREFKRHYHRYTRDVPDDEDTARWLALMQHHGAPTRLLDFTYSFYAAVFFAVETGQFGGPPAALWAVDHDWCWDYANPHLPQRVIELLKKDSKHRESTEALLATKKPLAVPMNPFFFDERLAVQQGVFLCPLALDRPFMENLGAKPHLDGTGHIMKVELQCKPPFIRDALRHLHEMNINRTTLFPGIDGLAQSMSNAVAMPWRFLEHRTWTK